MYIASPKVYEVLMRLSDVVEDSKLAKHDGG